MALVTTSFQVLDTSAAKEYEFLTRSWRPESTMAVFRTAIVTIPRCPMDIDGEKLEQTVLALAWHCGPNAAVCSRHARPARSGRSSALFVGCCYHETQ